MSRGATDQAPVARTRCCLAILTTLELTELKAVAPERPDLSGCAEANASGDMTRDGVTPDNGGRPVRPHSLLGWSTKLAWPQSSFGCGPVDVGEVWGVGAHGAGIQPAAMTSSPKARSR